MHCLSRFRYEASPFASLCVSDSAFWVALGFHPAQLKSTTVSIADKSARSERKVRVYTPILDQEMSCVAVEEPAPYSAPVDFVYAYVPADSSIDLEASVDLVEVEATPESLSTVLHDLLLKINYVHRFKMLNKSFQPAARMIYPSRLRTYAGRTVMEPVQMLPMLAATQESGSKLSLQVNTKSGQGNVQEVTFQPENPFGFRPVHRAYNPQTKKILPIEISSTSALGVLDQHCILSSLDLHMSRATVFPKRTGHAVVAVFNGKGVDGYFPINKMFSDRTYNEINFDIRSTHTHRSLNVINEKYSYILAFEIHNV